MDWALVIEAYFGRLQDDSVPAVGYGEASSYERLSATWTDERKLPPEEDLIAWYEGADIIEAWEQAQASPTVETLMARVVALEAELASKAVALDAVVARVEKVEDDLKKDVRT